MRKYVLVGALALVVAACGAATEELSEQLIENAAGVDNLEIDEDTGEVSFETDDGSVSIGGGAVPDGLPFDPPSGGEVLSSIVSGETIGLSLGYEQDRFDELVAYFHDQTDAMGEDFQSGESTYEWDDGQVQRSAQWVGSDWYFQVGDCYSASGGGDTLDTVCVTMSTTS